MGKIVSHADQVKRIVREKLEAGLQFTAIRAAELHRDDIGRQYPPSSTPGEFPARRTGNLQQSVDYVMDAPNLRSYMGYRTGQAPYFVYLIGSGRLGPIETVVKDASELRQAFINGAESVGSF